MTAQESIISALNRFGRPMVLRRVVSGGSDIDVTVQATADGAGASAGAGNIVQGVVTVKFSNAEIAAKSWPGPPRAGDRIIMDGRALTIQAPVDTKYLGTDILVHICQAKG